MKLKHIEICYEQVKAAMEIQKKSERNIEVGEIQAEQKEIAEEQSIAEENIGEQHFKPPTLRRQHTV